MENSEETRPSLYLNSFSSSALKLSVVENLAEDLKKQSRRHLKFQTPNELLTTRGTYQTPRTQISLSDTRREEIPQILKKIEYKNTESVETSFESEIKDFPTLK